MNPNDLLASFQSGSPKVVYEAAQKFVVAFHALEKEAAQLRFRVNFGSETCRTCEGLRAGPDVQATCFQVGECRYTNVKNPTAKQLDVLARLTDNG